MLTQDDATWVRANRAELLAGRTESITIWHNVSGGTDTYTGEPIAGVPVAETVDVVWKKYRSNSEREMVGGVELREGDVRVTFDTSVVLTDVTRLTRGVDIYELVAIDGRGLGGANRKETAVRRVT